MNMMDTNEDHLYQCHHSPQQDGAPGMLSKWGASFYELSVSHQAPWRSPSWEDETAGEANSCCSKVSHSHGRLFKNHEMPEASAMGDRGPQKDG